MNRRRYLAVCGTATACGLAGCNTLFGDSSSGSGTPQPTLVEGPAQFTDFKIEIPTKATVDTTVPVTISAFNYGSQSGSFSGSITTIKGASIVSKGIDLNGVESGKRGKTTVDLSFSVADEYVLAVSGNPPVQTSTDGYGTPSRTQLMDAKAKSRVTIGPKTATVGESFDLTSPLRVTLTDVTYRQGLYYKYSSGWGEKTTDLFSTTDNKTLALLHFDVENTGTESASFGPEPFTVSDGALHTDLRGASLNSAIGIKGDPFNGTTVQAGQQISGWLLAQLPKKRAKEGAVVGWQRDTHKTTPERAWNVKPTKLPSFTLEQWKLDEKQPMGEYLNEITVKNTGESKGKFRGIVDYKISDEGQNAWTPFEKINATLSPGKSKTFTLKKTWTYIQTLDYRVRPFGTTKTVEFTPPKLSFGETARVSNGTITVHDFQTNPTYTLSRDWDPVVNPDNGGIFALAHVEYVSDSETGPVEDYDFFIRANGKTYEEENRADGPMVDPVKGPFYEAPIGNVGAGKKLSGWISFEVPANVNPSNATVVFRDRYAEPSSSAEWSQK
jgi:hypothetical protein